MSRRESSTRLHIIEAVESLLAKRRSSEIRISDVTDEADVAVQTIYYHFGSLGRLIAEAQVSLYLQTAEPLSTLLLTAEKALAERNKTAFWEVVGNHIMLAWMSGQRGDERIVVDVIREVLSDPKSEHDLDQIVSESFARWVEIIEEAKAIGWANNDIDSKALISSFWAASVGQTIVGSSPLKGISSERIRDLFLNIVITKGSM